MSSASQMSQQNRPLVGVFWMVVSGLCFICVTGIVKHVGQTLPASEAVFLRYFLGLVFVIPMLGPMRAAIRVPGVVPQLAVRGAFHTIAALLWFYAMTRIPMAEVTAMNYLSPVFITIGAALFLGEVLAARRLFAIFAAIIGALIILRPGFREVEIGHLAMLGSAPAFAASYLLAKWLVDRIGPAATLGWMSLTTTIGLAPFAYFAWVPVSATELGWLFLSAAGATAAHYAMMLAFRAAPMTVTQPVTFLQLVWSAAMGAVIFAEPLDGWVILGGSLILGAVSIITWREAVLRRRSVTPPVVSG